jgi:thioredoxin-like negative regulator of GroEL
MLGKRPLVVKVRSGFPVGVVLVLIWRSRCPNSPLEVAKRCKDLKPKMESIAQRIAATSSMAEVNDKIATIMS